MKFRNLSRCVLPLLFTFIGCSMLVQAQSDFTVARDQFANGLVFEQISSPSFDKGALTVRWSYKPGLSGQFTGIDLALARCIDLSLQRDSAGRNENLKWTISANSASIVGSESNQSEWGARFLNQLMKADLAELWPVVQANWLASWEAEETEPNQAINRVQAQLLFTSGHPYGECHFPENIEAISIEKLEEHRSKFWRPNICHVVWSRPNRAGTIPVEWAKTLNAWIAREVPAGSIIIPGRPNEIQVAVIDRESDSISVSVAHKIRMKMNQPDAMALELLNLELQSHCAHQIDLMADDFMGKMQIRWSTQVHKLITELDSVLNFLSESTSESIEDSTLMALKQAYRESVYADIGEASTAGSRWIQLSHSREILDLNSFEEVLNQIETSDLYRMAAIHIRPEQLHIIIDGNRTTIESALAGWVSPENMAFFDTQAQRLSNYGPSPMGLTFEQVVVAHYEAQGGLDEIDKLRSLKTSGTLLASGSQSMNFEFSHLYGEGYHTAVKVDGQVMMEQKINNQGGQSIQMGQPRVLPDAEFQRHRQYLYSAYLMHLDEVGIQGSLAGTTTLEGSTYHVIELHREGQLEMSLFFDAQTNLLMRTVENRKGPTGPLLITKVISEYAETEGLFFPIKIAQISNNQKVIMAVESVEVNPKLDKSKFTWE